MATGPVLASVACYLGELFQTSKRPNTTLKMLGGIQGSINKTTAKEFPVGVFYDLRSPAQNARLEGAAAPAPQHRTITQATNVVQIFQEAVTSTYLSQSDKAVSGIVPINFGSQQGSPIDPRSPEWQVMRQLETIAQDANYSFLRGSFVNPADPSSTAMKTRGILTAMTTTSLDESATVISVTDPHKQYRGFVETLLLAVITQNGYAVDGTWVIQADATEYGNIISAFAALASNKEVESRDVVGQKIRTIYTKYGVLMVALDPDMPSDTIAIINYGVCGIVGLEVPGKGYLFEEPLAKDGSSDKTQIYGQLGVDHGPEWCHGKMLVPAASSLST